MSERPAPIDPSERPSLDGVLERIGGPLGIAESTLPTLVFIIARVAVGESVRTSAIAAVAFAAVLGVARLARRQTPLYAISGVVGVAISGYVASRTGRAEDFFLPGLLLNVAYAAAYAISIAVRYPLMGLIVAGITSSGMGWRSDPRRMREYRNASWIWVGLFLARIAVQLPLYLGGWLVALATARVAMGVPLFIVGVWLSWLVLRRPDSGRRVAVEPS